MKYFGNKSLSSFMLGLMRVSWVLVLVGSVAGVFFMSVMLFSPGTEDSAGSWIAQLHHMMVSQMKDEKDWEIIRDLPAWVKLLFLPYFGAVVVLVLEIIRKSQMLFDNFVRDTVFNQENVQLLSRIGRFLIILSIMTFNFSSLLVGLILLLVNQILKNGTSLQEEIDLTV